MSSEVSGTPHHIFLSTHNALRHDREEERVFLRVAELGQPEGHHASFMVYPFYDIEMVKRLVIKNLRLPNSTAISELRIFHRGTELPNYRTISAFSAESSRIKLYWSFKENEIRMGIRELGLRSPPRLFHLISEMNLAMQRGVKPKLTMDGTGGTYLMTNTKRQYIAVFKPRDEEAFAPNNPRGYIGKWGQKGFRSGVLSGEGSQREVAAFLLDAQYGGVANVPETTKVEACHPVFCEDPGKSGIISANRKPKWKEGSLQEFVGACETSGDYDPSVFSVGDGHKIGIFDLRVLNMDRNDGNILVTPISGTYDVPVAPSMLTPDGRISKFRLIPIDHGLILPDTMEIGDIDLVWFSWPQSGIPFSEEELRHIFSIDPDRDSQRLARKLEIRDDSLRTMRAATRCLQIGARMHLNLAQITSLMVRFDDLESPSILERLVKTALIQAWTTVNSTSLIQYNRLAGGMILDLHLADAHWSAAVPPHGGSSTEWNAKGRGRKGVDQQKTNHGKSTENHKSLTEKDCGPVKDGNVEDGAGRHSKDRVRFRTDSEWHLMSTAGTALEGMGVENGWGGSASAEKGFSSIEKIDSPEGREAQKGLERQIVSRENSARLPATAVDQAGRVPGPPASSISVSIESSASCTSSASSSFSESGSSAHSDHSRSDGDGLAFSRITGVPLEKGMTGDRLVKHRRRRKRKESTVKGVDYPMERNDTVKLILTPNGFAPTPNDAELKKSTTTDITRTTIRRPGGTALARRGTKAKVANAKSVWTLIDGNKKIIPLDWQNPLFENTFFESLGRLVKHHIMEAHPHWEDYPFNGDILLRELEERGARRKRAGRRSTSSGGGQLLAHR